MRLEINANSPLIQDADEKRLGELRQWLAGMDLDADHIRSMLIDTETDEAWVEIYDQTETGQHKVNMTTGTVCTHEEKVTVKNVGRFIQWVMNTTVA